MQAFDPKQLASDARGTVFVEYVVLLTLVAVTGAVAIASVGLPLLRLFQAQLAWLTLPIP